MEAYNDPLPLLPGKSRVKCALTRDLMGGPKGPPGGFSSITQIRLGIELWNFQYLSAHQFYASSENNLPEVTKGQKL